MKYYAQLNVIGECFAVSQLSGSVSSPGIIELEFYDESRLGQRFVNGHWERFDKTLNMWVAA